ncbi:hypothetical protein AY599_28200 [Leptolyngbya valderiana BDU 20041]|nr:hypothetical protein AY599_28200 [Leptolyngbya valderiana BDU 20041]
MQRGPETQECFDRHLAVGRRRLGQIPNMLANPDWLAGSIDALNTDPTRVGRRISGDDSYCCALSRPIGPQKPGDLPRRHVKAHTAQGADGAVALLEVSGFDHGPSILGKAGAESGLERLAGLDGRDGFFAEMGLSVRMKHGKVKCRSWGVDERGANWPAWAFLASQPPRVCCGGVLGQGGNG